jgi:cytochrome b-561
MVSGFFYGQVIAITMWSLIPQHDAAKILHVLFHLAALGCLIAGLHAIIQYEHHENLPALTSMHSWLGVMTTTLFGMQIIGGFVLGAGTAGGADIGVMKPLAMMHRALGVISLAFTAATILSGIQNQLLGPRGNNGVSFIGSCGFNVGGNSNDYPARYYDRIPDACRLALGLGVTVMLSKLFR